MWACGCVFVCVAENEGNCSAGFRLLNFPTIFMVGTGKSKRIPVKEKEFLHSGSAAGMMAYGRWAFPTNTERGWSS